MLRRLRRQDGFTLVELLAALAIGMVVLLAAFDLLDRSLAVGGNVSARTDAGQRGRTALDEMTRALRSQVCVNGVAPVRSASPTQVTFTADLSDGSQPSDMRQLSFDSAARTISQSITRGTGAEPALTFPGPAQATALLTNVDAEATTPVFSYWAVRPGTGGTQLDPLAATVAPADLNRIARIDIAFVAHAGNQPEAFNGASTLEDSIYVRSVDPSSASPQVMCP